MSRPLILIDFDGVFNIVNELDAARKIWEDVQEYTIPLQPPIIGNMRALISPTVLGLFSRIIEADVVDVEWLTSWKRDTESFPKAIGFPVAVWHDEPADSTFFPWWKLDVVKRIDREGAGGAPILWIGDDIRHDEETQGWLTQHQNVRTLSTFSFKGITSEQIVEITDFIETHTGWRIVL